MITDDQFITRRAFIKAAAPCLALGLNPIVAARTLVLSAQLTETNLVAFRGQLLEVVNVERGLAGVPPVALDEFACQVEGRHALDMVTGRFLSHWGSDDLKPYQRYSFAGGTDYTAENVSATDHIPSLKSDRVAAEFVNMNIRMHAEKPPHDGHRRAILGPEATHVGFGMAINGDNLRLAQMFIARHSEIESVPRVAKPKAKLVIKGRLLSRDHVFQQADVFFEPLPVPGHSQSQAGHQYSLPDEYVTLLPVLSVRMAYPNGSTGTIDLGPRGHFRVPITLFKDKPGIYTVVIWIRKNRNDRAFPVTEICIKAE